MLSEDGTTDFDVRALEAGAHAAQVRAEVIKSDPIITVTQTEPGVYVLKFSDSHLSPGNNLAMAATGEMDALTSGISDFASARLLERKAYKLVVDLSNVDNISKDAVGALLTIKRNIDKTGGKMALMVGDKHGVFDRLAQYKLDKQFTFAGSIAEAISILRTQTPSRGAA